MLTSCCVVDDVKISLVGVVVVQVCCHRVVAATIVGF